MGCTGATAHAPGDRAPLRHNCLINLFGGIVAYKNVNLFNLVINLLVTQPWLPFIKAPKVFSSCNVKMYQL